MVLVLFVLVSKDCNKSCMLAGCSFNGMVIHGVGVINVFILFAYIKAYGNMKDGLVTISPIC